MTATVVFPDIITLVRARTAAAGFTGDIFSRIPDDRETRTAFIVATRVGGTARNEVTDEPVLTIEAWATSEEASHDLCQEFRAYLHGLPEPATADNPIYRITELAGPSFFPDNDTPDPPRDLHRMTVQFAVRGVPLS